MGAATLTATGDIKLDGETDGLASEILDLRFVRAAGNLDEIRIGTTYAAVVPSDEEVVDPVLYITASGSNVIVGSSNLIGAATYQLQETSTPSTSNTWNNLGASFLGVTETNITVNTAGKTNNFFRMISE